MAAVTEPEEIEANRFAMELLMPRGWLERDLRKMGGIDIESGEGIKQLAKKYQVSEQLMALRLGQLFPL